MIKKPVHTTLKPETYDKLKNKYGEGTINDGIEKVVEIAENKQYNVKSELLKIANNILAECKEDGTVKSLKLLFCRACGDLVSLRLDEIRECKCGNVQGRYSPDDPSQNTIEVSIKDTGYARIVGISNAFLREENIPFYHSSYERTLFQQQKSHIIITFPFCTPDVKQMKTE